MFCKQCGVQVKPSTHFCSVCGAKLDKQEVASQQESPFGKQFDEYRKNANTVKNPMESDENQEPKNNFSATSVFTSSTKNTSVQPTSEEIVTAPYQIAERAQTRLGISPGISNSKTNVSRSPNWQLMLIGLAITIFIAFFGYRLYEKNQEANQLRLELEQNAMAHKRELERLNEGKIADEGQVADQEAKVQTEDQQTIQTSPAEQNTTTRTSSPSFDCAKASTNSEHLICSNANLAAVDVEMAQIYKKVFENANDKKSLIRDQNQWRKNYRDICKDVACMLNAYAVRTKQLNQQEE